MTVEYKNNTMKKIMVVDDDLAVRLAISENLTEGGFTALEAANGQEAIFLFTKNKPSAVLLDLKMPGMDGMRILQELKRIDPEIPIIIVTAHGDIPQAVEAIRLGAYDFISKPPDFNKLLIALKRATERMELEKTVQRLTVEVESSLEFTLGRSGSMKDIIRQVHQVAASDFSLILQGETGTGKSFLARTIHHLSNRVKGPFVTVDIGAIPETLLESELFGYEKGAFTGAEKRKKGFFEIANGGTLLIDELQNTTSYVQSKLLAAVEERRVYPLGTTEPVMIDVRIIGATNTDVRKLVREKKFKEDLFYRLGEFIISIPPLRERAEDIPFFADKFFREAAEELNKQIIGLSEDALALLKQHAWPGNVREIKNVVRRAVLLANDPVIAPEHMNFLVQENRPEMEAAEQHVEQKQTLPPLSLADLEKRAIKQALELTRGNKSKAAAMLQIDYSTLLRKIKQYSVSPSR